MNFRNDILAKLEKLGWSRYRLAQESGVPHQRVYFYLRTGKGISVPSVEKLLTTLERGEKP